MQVRLGLPALGLFLLIAVAAGCGGSSSGTTLPKTSPSSSPSTAPASTTAAVGTSATAVATVSLGTAGTAQITIPKTSSGSATATIAGSATAPSGVTALLKVREQSTAAPSPNPIAYLTITTSAAISFTSFPSFTVTLPSSTSTSGENFYIGFYTTDPSFGLDGAWDAPVLAGTVSGQTVSFTGSATPSTITLSPSYSYVFCLYEVASSSTATPSPAPSSSSTAPAGPEYTFPTPQATMASAVGTVTLTQPPVTVAANFGAATSGSGTILVNFSLSTSDITPTLATDNATNGFTALVYGSFYNPTSNAIDFGTETPAITVTDTSGFNGATSCELDVYNNAGSGYQWNTIPNATGTPSGNSVTLNQAAVTGGGGLQLSPGQQIIAISCN